MLTRRVFLRQGVIVAGSAAFGSLLAACAPSAPGGAPAAPPAAQPTAAPPKPTAAPATPAAAQPTAAPAKPTAAAAPAATPAPAAAPAVAKPGGTLVVGFSTDPISMDPAESGEPQARMVRGAIHEALIDIDAQGKPIPRLAESWEQPDPATYVFKLRRGVKFHDGTPFDAEAVKANIERMRNPDLKNIWRSEIAALDSVEVVDASTVRIRAKGPFAAFAIPFYDMNGMQRSPAAMEKWGAEYGMHPVGTGPFKFVEYQKDTQTVLERNPDYWDTGKPHLDRLIFRPIPNSGTRLTELRSGGVQMIEYLPFQDLERLKGAGDVVISEKTGFRVDWLFFNTEQGPGASKEFRQAWNWLIDRDAFQQVVYKDTGSPAWDLLLPGSPYHDPNYKPTTRDLGKAKELLTASGVQLPLEITMYVQQDPVRQQEVQILQANGAEVGINITVAIEDSAAWFARHEKTTDFTMGLTWWGYRPDPDQYLGVNLQTKGSWNLPRYSNPRMDELLETQRVERDEAKRVKLFRELAELTTADAPLIPYHYGSNIKGLSPRVKDFVHRQDGLVRFTDIRFE
jgi:peptide/nickel transport system substrate-binding protein